MSWQPGPTGSRYRCAGWHGSSPSQRVRRLMVRRAGVRMSAIDRATIGRDEIRAVVEGRHGDPFSILGPHRVGGHLVVRAFLPGAERVAVLAGSTETALERIDDAGLFEGTVEEETGAYLLAVTWEGSQHLIEDPYRFPLLLSDYDLHLLAEGTHYRSYERLGAHPITLAAVDGVSFAVWAPN